MNKGKNICTSCNTRSTRNTVCGPCKQKEDYRSPFKQAGLNMKTEMSKGRSQDGL